MKALVAADGVLLDSPIAKRFEKAPWFLVVNLDDLMLQAFQNLTPTDHYGIVAKAKQLGVTVIVTPNIGARSRDLIGSYNMAIAYTHHLSVREGVEGLKRGELKTIDAPTLQRSVEAHEFIARVERKQRRLQRKSGKGAVMSTGSPRAHHHLQQYGGRGH